MPYGEDVVPRLFLRDPAVSSGPGVHFSSNRGWSFAYTHECVAGRTSFLLPCRFRYIFILGRFSVTRRRPAGKFDGHADDSLGQRCLLQC